MLPPMAYFLTGILEVTHNMIIKQVFPHFSCYFSSSRLCEENEMSASLKIKFSLEREIKKSEKIELYEGNSIISWCNFFLRHQSN